MSIVVKEDMAGATTLRRFRLGIDAMICPPREEVAGHDGGITFSNLIHAGRKRSPACDGRESPCFRMFACRAQKTSSDDTATNDDVDVGNLTTDSAGTWPRKQGNDGLSTWRMVRVWNLPGGLPETMSESDYQLCTRRPDGEDKLPVTSLFIPLSLSLRSKKGFMMFQLAALP